jgi:hypothetical protein
MKVIISIPIIILMVNFALAMEAIEQPPLQKPFYKCKTLYIKKYNNECPICFEAINKSFNAEINQQYDQSGIDFILAHLINAHEAEILPILVQKEKSCDYAISVKYRFDKCLLLKEEKFSNATILLELPYEDLVLITTINKIYDEIESIKTQLKTINPKNKMPQQIFRFKKCMKVTELNRTKKALEIKIDNTAIEFIGKKFELKCSLCSYKNNIYDTKNHKLDMPRPKDPKNGLIHHLQKIHNAEILPSQEGEISFRYPLNPNED